MNIDKGLIRHWAMLFESENEWPTAEQPSVDDMEDMDSAYNSDVWNKEQTGKSINKLKDELNKFPTTFAVLTVLWAFVKKFDANEIKKICDDFANSIKSSDEFKQNEIKNMQKILQLVRDITKNYDWMKRPFNGQSFGGEDVYESSDIPDNSIKQTELEQN